MHRHFRPSISKSQLTAPFRATAVLRGPPPIRTAGLAIAHAALSWCSKTNRVTSSLFEIENGASCGVTRSCKARESVGNPDCAAPRAIDATDVYRRASVISVESQKRESREASDHSNCSPHLVVDVQSNPATSQESFDAIHVRDTSSCEFQQQVTFSRSSGKDPWLELYKRKIAIAPARCAQPYCHSDPQLSPRDRKHLPHTSEQEEWNLTSRDFRVHGISQTRPTSP